MKIEGSYTFKAPRQKVWDVLLDPKMIAQCMPGCEGLKEIGPDHEFALEPKELKDMVKGIREVEEGLGDGRKIRFPSEEIHYIRGRRSLFSRKALKQGEILRIEDLAVLRPGIGISPHFIDIICGAKIKKDVAEDSPLQWEHLL